MVVFYTENDTYIAETVADAAPVFASLYGKKLTDDAIPALTDNHYGSYVVVDLLN